MFVQAIGFYTSGTNYSRAHSRSKHGDRDALSFQKIVNCQFSKDSLLRQSWQSEEAEVLLKKVSTVGPSHEVPGARGGPEPSPSPGAQN